MSGLADAILARSRRFRAQRFQRFVELLRLDATTRILDVGGWPSIWLGTGFEAQVTILNLVLPEHRPPPFTWVEGDACDLRGFADQSFDVIYSNSVIEHVGDRAQQQRMADEVRRVGRRYWVQTPHRHFPLEPHFLFPFFQYLPRGPRHVVARHWPWSFARLLKLDPIYEADHIWLLDRPQLQALFPDARLHDERVLGLLKSVTAVRT